MDDPKKSNRLMVSSSGNAKVAFEQRLQEFDEYANLVYTKLHLLADESDPAITS